MQINTAAPALGPEEVETQITYPVEQALSGLPKLESLRSISKFGLSQVNLIFEDGTDIYFARQVVNERLGTVEIPIGIERPKMGPVSTGLGEVFHTRKVRPGVTNDTFTEIIAGVLPGEVVATKGSAVLRAELLRANLGDG